MKIAGYETDLTEAQWELMEPMLPAAKRLGRKRTPLRRILDALLRLAKAGCQWRLLPVDFPPWQTVCPVFRKWIADGIWEGLDARLRALVRSKAGKRCRPTAAILDSQSVKSSPHGGEAGYDAGKNIKGRKRHLLVDTLGLLLGVKAAPGPAPRNGPARCCSWLLCSAGSPGSGSSGSTAATPVRSSPAPSGNFARNWRPKSSSAPPRPKASMCSPAAGSSNGPSAGSMRHRRLVRDHETSCSSAEAFVLPAMIRIQIRRLA